MEEDQKVYVNGGFHASAVIVVRLFGGKRKTGNNRMDYGRDKRNNTDQRVLYDLLSDIWCEYTCAPRMRKDWSRDNRTLGQCSVTAFLAQDIFSGKVYGILRPGGNYHCYNVIGDVVFDLTSEQFGGEVLNYSDNPEQFREDHFAKTEKFERYSYLKNELLKLLRNMS